MKIIKYGHSALSVEEGGTKILIDPGIYMDPKPKEAEIDAILFTHGQHQDHLDMEFVKKVVAANPELDIYCTSETAELLKKENIGATVAKAGDALKIKEISAKVFGDKHEEVYPGISAGLNIGFLINDKLFCPGDAYIYPEVPVEVLALAVAGPWVRTSEAVDYAKKIKPNKAFPVHDGNLKETGPAYRHPSQILPQENIEFVPLELGKEYEF